MAVLFDPDKYKNDETEEFEPLQPLPQLPKQKNILKRHLTMQIQYAPLVHFLSNNNPRQELIFL